MNVLTSDNECIDKEVATTSDDDFIDNEVETETNHVSSSSEESESKSEFGGGISDTDESEVWDENSQGNEKDTKHENRVVTKKTPIYGHIVIRHIFTHKRNVPNQYINITILKFVDT